MEILTSYQKRYAGAMYSGCGGGYLFVISKEPVPGAFQINIRLARPADSAKHARPPDCGVLTPRAASRPQSLRALRVRVSCGQKKEAGEH